VSAATRADKDNKKALAQAKAAVAAHIKQLRKDATRKAPTRAEERQLYADAAAAAPRVAAADVEGTIVAEMMAFYRDTFVERAGDILSKRGGGAASKAGRARLAAAEARLMKKLKKASPEALRRAVREQRDSFSSQLDAQIERAKLGFRTLVENHYRHINERQAGVSRIPAGFGRPTKGLEPTIEARNTGGLMSVDKGNKGDQPVAVSVVLWLAQLRATSPVGFTAGTYWGHSWQEYSVDMFPTIPQREDGYYERDKMVAFFLAADAAARALKCEWRALYTDFEVAKIVNEKLGMRRVVFQWHHGPAPYVLHAHFDIMPTYLKEPMQSRPEPAGLPMCYPDDLMTLDLGFTPR
jgi:hypothetical protein